MIVFEIIKLQCIGGPRERVRLDFKLGLSL